MNFEHMTLRGRLTLLIGSVVSVVVMVVSGVLIFQLKANLDEAMASKSEAMRDALSRKGIAMARNVAFTSGRAIVTGNLAFLLDIINTTVANDKEIAYGILMDKERRALVHSVPALANAVLEGPTDLFAANQTDVATQHSTFNGDDTLEVVAPVSVANAPWGSVRLGMSLRLIREEIAQSESLAKRQLFNAIVAGLAAAILPLLIGLWAGIKSATALVKPLQRLSDGANLLREGDMTTRVVVGGDGGREFQNLALAFNSMIEAVQIRETSLQGALAQAQEANRLKSEFLANVSHELRTPLNAIINVPQALCRDYETHLAWHCPSCESDYELDPDIVAHDNMHETCPSCSSSMNLELRAFYHGDPSQHYHFLQATLQAAQHLLSVVNDILDFSKLEAGKMTIHPTSTQVVSVVNDVKDTMSMLARNKQIDLVWPAVSPTYRVWADPLKFAQIILNLMGNAIKFTPEQGRIELSLVTRDDSKEAEFCVSDTGIGIPEEKISALFESFRQVDGSHTRSHGGTGLGLAICRKLVGLHGGRIWVESTPGMGSRFYFTIPLEQEILSKDGWRKRQGPFRVLVVDDDPTQLELMDRYLREGGYHTTCLANSQQVREKHRESPFDLLILDVMMPKTSGLTILKELSRDSGKLETPVIVSSAYHSNKTVAESAGAVWLPKPWSRDEFLACVNAVTGKSHELPQETPT